MESCSNIAGINLIDDGGGFLEAYNAQLNWSPCYSNDWNIKYEWYEWWEETDFYITELFQEVNWVHT